MNTLPHQFIIVHVAALQANVSVHFSHVQFMSLISKPENAFYTACMMITMKLMIKTFSFCFQGPCIIQSIITGFTYLEGTSTITFTLTNVTKNGNNLGISL